MKRVLFNILLFISIILSSFSQTHAQKKCANLLHYRDFTLIIDYDNALKKFQNKYRLNSEAIAEMRKIRNATLDERSWYKPMSTKIAMSDAGLTTAVIAKNIQIICTLIGDLLKFNPEIGVSVAVAENVAEKSLANAETVYSYIEAGKPLFEIIDGKAEQEAYKQTLSLGGPVAITVKTAWNFASGVSEMVEMPEDRDKLRSEVKRILDMVDKAVAKYQLEITKSKIPISDINEIKAGIDKYLIENCPNLKTPTTNVKTTTRELAADNVNNIKTIDGKKAIGKTIYIFFSATIVLEREKSQFSGLQSPKYLEIISGPILFQGDLSDPMINEKENFIAEIEKKMKNKPKNIEETLRNNNYEIINLHYGKPYSNAILKERQDAFDAINNYIKSTKDLYSGLAEVEFLELF